MYESSVGKRFLQLVLQSIRVYIINWLAYTSLTKDDLALKPLANAYLMLMEQRVFSAAQSISEPYIEHVPYIRLTNKASFEFDLIAAAITVYRGTCL